MSDGSVWLFGYGSLVWRPDFAFAERRTAWLAGWERRFWQGSTDHRGRPGAPGRVVTLVARAGARCGGMAYRVESGREGAVLAGLDERERGGYRRLSVELELLDPGPSGRSGGQGVPGSQGVPGDQAIPSGPGHPGSPGSRAVPGIVYLAAEGNPNYLGPASLAAIAAQVAAAEGPSGSNREYVERLADALRSLGVVDPHVLALAEHLTEGLGAPGDRSAQRSGSRSPRE